VIREGLKDLWRARVATGIAWLAALAAALALEAAFRTAVLDLRRLASLGDVFHALMVMMFGALVGSLLLDTARALTLVAVSHPGQPFLALGLTRVPALITVTAVEATVEMFLLLGVARVVPSHSPLAAAFVAAPALFLCAVMFAAARVAMVLAARGLRPALALLHGFDVVMRRLPSLLRLFGAWFLWTLPLTLPAAFLRILALMARDGLATAMARSLSLALFELAALVGYAALANLVGRDGRLTTG
jgi:hypothetical protein